MKMMFYTQLRVLPDSGYHPEVVGALAHVWVVASTPDDAVGRAMKYIKKDHWTLQSVETAAIAIEREQFQDKVLGVKCFDRASRDGIYGTFVGWETSE